MNKIVCLLLCACVALGGWAAAEETAARGLSGSGGLLNGPGLTQQAADAAAFVLRVEDQYGDPVANVYMNFCTDTACTLNVTDEDGLIRLNLAEASYHLQIIAVPAGYRFDPAFEADTADHPDGMIVTVTKE